MYDTLELLRPKLQICASWDEASQAADALDKEFANKLGELLPYQIDDDDDDDVDSNIDVCRRVVTDTLWLCFIVRQHSGISGVAQW